MNNMRKLDIRQLMTLNSSHSKNKSFVIDPSMAVLAMTPSNVRRASVEVCLPHTNTCFFTARCPFFDLPYLLPVVLSSFDTSSKNQFPLVSTVPFNG
jgi:hypothetical protein